MARFKIEWSLEARKDLIDILEFYITRNSSADYSTKLNSKINKSIRLLSQNPFLGVKTDDSDIRALITSDYQIIYEIFDKLLLILMIWDCRRDPEDKVIDLRRK
jgi:plasmid stabilization system protein ParE